MIRKKLKFTEALEEVRKLRTSADPNLGFVGQLIAMEATLLSLKSHFNFSKQKQRSNSRVTYAKGNLKTLIQVPKVFKYCMKANKILSSKIIDKLPSPYDFISKVSDFGSLALIQTS
jgi:hypothetical protein